MAPGPISNQFPSNNQIKVDVPTIILSWVSGTETTSFDVYFGKNPSPGPSELISSSQLNEYTSVYDLDYFETYYWRIDSNGPGGTTTGDVISFSTVPLKFITPTSGDKVQDVVVISGYTRPGYGIHIELHSNQLLADGYIAADDVLGNFDIVIAYTNLDFGTNISVVGVSQDGGNDSVEVIVGVVQNKPPQSLLPRGRVGRGQLYDQNTIALWNLESPVIGPDDNTGSVWAHAAFNGSTAPSGYSLVGSTGYTPTIAGGAMTIYSYDDTAQYSRLQSTSSNASPIYTSGFSYKTRVRFAPDPYNTINCTVTAHSYGTSTVKWRVTATESYWYFGSYLSGSLVTYSMPPGWNMFDWNEIIVYGKQLDLTNLDSVYTELYFNNTKIAQTYAIQSSDGYGHYLGNPFTGSRLWTADFDYFAVDNSGNPFVTTHMSNAGWNRACDLSPQGGISARPINDQNVPFTSATRFNGTNQYATNSAPDLDITAPFTIEGWFKTFGDGVTQVIVNKESAPTNGFGIYINTSNQLIMYVANGTTNSLSNAPQVPYNTFCHFAMTYDGTTLIGYFNGVEFNRQNYGFTANTAQNFCIGADSSSPANYFYGYMAQVKVSNRVVPAWEIYNIVYSVEDPIRPFEADEYTIARFDLRTQDFIGKAIGYSTHQNGSYNAPYSFDFSQSPEYYNQFFNYVTVGDGYAGMFDGYIKLTSYKEIDVQHYTYVDTAAKLRLTGNFEITVNCTYSLKTTLTAGIVNVPFRLYLYGMSNRQLLIEYEENGTNKYIDTYTPAPSNSGNDDSDRYTIATSQPDTIKFKISREGSNFTCRYALNGGALSTMPTDVSMCCTNEDMYMRIMHNIVDSPATGGYAEIKITSIDISGVNGAPGDGYIIHDTLGYVTNAVNVAESPFGPVYDFVGPNQALVTYRHSEEFNHQDLSIEIWAYPNYYGDFRLVGRTIEPTNEKFSMDLGADGYFAAEIRDNDRNSLVVYGGSYTPGKWSYFAMTYSASEKKLRTYINGTQVGSGENQSLTNNFTSNLGISFGRDPSPGYNTRMFFGKMASIRMSNKVRSPIEIFNTYNGSKIKE